MAHSFDRLKRLRESAAVTRSRRLISKHRHNTPWFVVRETFAAFQQHNGLGISASLAFYGLFALIPMALLMFFLLSHLVLTSDYAIVQLAILTSNLVPKLSQSIMLEVYNISSHQAAWGVLGMLALLWAITPLAGALRASFRTMGSVVEAPSFLRRKIKDLLAVLGILLLLFLFTFGGVLLDKLLEFLRPEFVSAGLVSSFSSLLLITVMLTAFYRAFFPARISLAHALIGSLLTAALWIIMRPAFELFLLVHQSYGAVFGGMKNMFISIGWLYYTFAVFLLGTELIATLRRKDVLMLKGLFSGKAHRAGYLDKLMRLFGRTLTQGEYVFREGEHGHEMYFVVSGHVTVYHKSIPIREFRAGDYFGEMAVLTDAIRTTDAIVGSESAQIVRISADNIETLLAQEPSVAMSFLREMALRLRQTSGINELRQ